MPIKMNVLGLSLDERTKSPILLLQGENGDMIVPINILATEALAVSSVLKGGELEPTTYDAFLDTLNALQAQIRHVLVCEEGGRYFAELHLHHNGQDYAVPYRVADAVALAIRTNSPVFAENHIMELGQVGNGKDVPRVGKVSAVMRDTREESLGQGGQEFDGDERDLGAHNNDSGEPRAGREQRGNDLAGVVLSADVIDAESLPKEALQMLLERLVPESLKKM